MAETPFRVTLDLQIISGNGGGGNTGASFASHADFQLQAEVFKQEWDAFRNLPQPWEVELAADRLFLLAD